MNKSFQVLIDKLRKVKHIEIIIAIVIGLIILSVYFNPFANKNEDKTETGSISINTDTSLSDEERLKAVLATISGVGKTEVMITYETGTELIPATDYSEQVNTETQYTHNGTNTSENSVISKKPVTVYQDGENRALILVERKPQIRGVIVVAEGAADVEVKMELYKAVQTVLQISAEKVNVFEMNK